MAKILNLDGRCKETISYGEIEKYYFTKYGDGIKIDNCRTYNENINKFKEFAKGLSSQEIKFQKRELSRSAAVLGIAIINIGRYSYDLGNDRPDFIMEKAMLGKMIIEDEIEILNDIGTD